MPSFTTAEIRNVVLAGHAGAGKTSLVDAMLHAAGVIGRAGTIEEKNTVSDYEPEEKEHLHSLSSALAQFTFDGKRINLVDTPGYPDFMSHGISALPAGDAVAVVVDPQRGVQMVTRRIMKLAEETNLPRMIVVNKLDAEELDLKGLLEQLRESFGTGVVPLNLPRGGGTAVVDCLKESEGDADFSSVAEAHSKIVDQVVEVDDALMEAYLETGEMPSPDKFRAAFGQALRQGHIIPLCFVSARTGVGVKELLTTIGELAPSPLEGNPRPFALKKGETEEEWKAEADPQKPMVAHVFKVTTDKFVGKLAFFRVHQGTLKGGSQVFRNDERRSIRFGHVFHAMGKDHADTEEIVAGDIGVVAKVAELQLNDVLHADQELANLVAKTPPLPRPMYGLAIKPKTRQDETKVGPALQKLAEEDPTFVVERIASTNQTVARGTGVLHMRVMLEKLKARFAAEVDTETPKVPYLETISTKAEGHHRHKKQTGGAGQFGEVYMRIEPLPRDSKERYVYVDDTFGGSIPKQYIPAIEKGVVQALEAGAVAGYPMQGVKISVYDGKYHAVDSKEVAFVTAGKRAFVKAVQAARPVLLEPHVNLEITIPSENMGDVTADLSGRRGRPQGTEMLPGNMCVIRAVAPLAEVQTYATTLKSMTGGRGSYSMEFSHYDPTPPQIQQDIIAQYKPKEEED